MKVQRLESTGNAVCEAFPLGQELKSQQNSQCFEVFMNILTEIFAKKWDYCKGISTKKLHLQLGVHQSDLSDQWHVGYWPKWKTNTWPGHIQYSLRFFICCIKILLICSSSYMCFTLSTLWCKGCWVLAYNIGSAENSIRDYPMLQLTHL